MFVTKGRHLSHINFNVHKHAPFSLKGLALVAISTCNRKERYTANQCIIFICFPNYFKLIIILLVSFLCFISFSDIILLIVQVQALTL